MIQRLMPRRLTLLILIILCAVSSELRAKTPKEVIALQKSYKLIEDFQADFEQIEYNPILDRKKKSEGSIYSLAEGKIFWHTKRPKVFKVISDGNDIWLYYPQSRQLFEEKGGALDSQTKLAFLFLRRDGNIEKHFKVTVKKNKKSKTKLILIPKKRIGVNKIEVYLTTEVFEKGLFFDSLVFYFPLKRTTTLNLKNFKFNQKILQKHKKNALDPQIDEAFRFRKTAKRLGKNAE